MEDREVITEEQVDEWAEHFIKLHNDFYEFGDLYEDEEFTEDFPDEEDWVKVYNRMTAAKIKVYWEDSE